MTPQDQRDQAWQAAQDAAAVGEHAAETSLDGREPDWDLELAFYDELEREATRPAEPVEPAVDEQLITAAVAQAAVRESESGTLGRRVWLTVAVAAAAAVALMVLWPRSMFEVSRGVWVDEEGAAFAAGDSVAADAWLVAQDDACLSLAEGELCAEGGSRLRLRGVAPKAVLTDGGVWIESGRWTVLAAGAERVLSSGDTFRIPGPMLAQAHAAPATPVPSPPVEVLAPSSDAKHTTPAPPELEASTGPAKRPSMPTETAATLLARARTQLGEGKQRAADKTYAQLLRAHPKSAEAGVARVALGQLRLKRGRARSALVLFEAYLKAKGPLAEEAAWGRVQALKALGRREALATAVAAFLVDHPRSVYRKRAQESVVP